MNSPFSLTRRHWLRNAGYGIGSAALASLLRPQGLAAGMAGLPHFPGKAKRVICLFMSGGMSHVDSFDPKPLLKKMDREPLPESVFKGRKPLGMSRMQGVFPALGSPFGFQQHGQSGAWISDLFPHLAKQADKLCMLKGMVSDAINHDPAIIFMNSGAQLPGRPSVGSWLSYGLGSENENMPSFVVMVSKKTVDQPLSSRLWDSGFLPAQHQGVLLRSGKEPVLYLNNPPGLPASLQRKTLDHLRAVQQEEFSRRGDTDITARMEQHEMAFRMQSTVPDLLDLSKERPETVAKYGKDVGSPGSFAANCLQARRMCESGVRFIQLYHPGWDHHAYIQKGFTDITREIDQPMAALLEDMSERGLLQDTLVMCVTEFGRTPYSQGTSQKRDDFGREHHRDAFTCWMAGAGVKGGMSYGMTDDFGFDVVEGKTSVNDFHATFMHLMGIEHERFTYRYQGRDFRLTDVAGKVIQPILA